MNKKDYRWLFSQECVFLGGALDPNVLKIPDLPEVAFVGRSNVGKSSLINALVRRKQLARTSKTPGRTQQINFFQLSSHILLVDLPGYGYAQVSHKTSLTWRETLTDYLLTRRNLRCLYVLIDARHGLKASDYQLFDFLQNTGTSFQIIFTKTDKVKASEFNTLKEDTFKQLQSYATCLPEIICTSALNSEGLDELRQRITDFVHH